MKKRTSKSASATPETSLPSGTSARTDGTASPRKRNSKGFGKFGVVVTRVHQMSTDEFRQSLVVAGIINSAGKLEKKYKGSKNHKIDSDEQG